MNPLASLAPAIKDIASAQKSSFATTQAVWRFLNNESISFKQLNQPIETLALREIHRSTHDFALVIHDWSQLQYATHNNKLNRLTRTHQRDKVYELQSSLLVDAANGLPIAPLAQTLCDDGGRYSTFSGQHDARASHLDALYAQIVHIESLGISRTLVHIIDREGDSIAHLRDMTQQGYQWLIRGKEGNLIEYDGKSLKVREVADQLSLQQIKPVFYKGQQAILHVGETEVCMTRAARPKQKDKDGKRLPPQQGEPLRARLIVSVVKDEGGNQLARWSLISNVSAVIAGTELANWYYWRWTIECYFKLLKQAGHDVESWLQTTPSAILRRLLICSMACVLSWRIQRSTEEQNIKVRAILARLSGRQLKRGRIESAPSILAGVSILLNTLQLLSEYSMDDLKSMAEIALGYPHKNV